ncbi:hypothetical protein Ae706Ps2_1434 [Pseudonocardia sp. Ae706_Ps2]|nr:hypothetical protein Ae706Ps2_1434 [Pseudonocardia sp. Ae706_Ps2]
MLQDVAAQVVADPVDVPVRGAQQPLHPVRRHRPGVFGEGPAVLPLEPREQASQVGSDPPARLDPAETARDQLHHRVQRGHPPGKINHAVIITAERPSASHHTPNCRCSTRG